MTMTLWEFITLTVEWIRAEVNNLGLEKQMRAARNTVINWWNFGRLLAIVGLIVVLALNLAGFILGWIFATGIWSAIAGLVIAPVILIMLAWWTPLAAVLGFAAEIVHGKIIGAAQNGGKWAEGWMKIALGVLMWQLIVSFFMAVVPYWHAPSRVPIIVLSALLVVIMSYVWGSGLTYRKVIRGSVYVVLILNVVFCFWPATAKAVSTKFEKTDGIVARSVNSDGVVWGTAKSIWHFCVGGNNAEASGQKMEIYSRVLTQGRYGYIVESGNSSIWLESATAYDIKSPNMEFDIVTVDGRIIPSFQKDKWPVGEPFQIIAITTRQNLEITVL